MDLTQALLSVVCENGGRISQRHLAHVAHTKGFLGKGATSDAVERKVAKVIGQMEGMVFTTEIEVGEVMVSGTTSLGICEAFCSKAGCKAPVCGSLHICKFYVFGNCKFGPKCSYGHALRNPRNFGLLSNHFMEKLQEQQIRLLLTRKRSRSSMPPICKFYNVGSGCRQGEGGAKCANLHICRHYIKGSCTFGMKCKRSHNIFDAQPKALLEKYGIDVNRSPKDVLLELREAYGEACENSSSDASSSISGSGTGNNDSASTSGHEKTKQGEGFAVRSPEVDTNEICTYALRKKCNYGDHCNKHHMPFPYQWQFKMVGSSRWEDMSPEANEAIERSFSDPQNKSYETSSSLADGRHVDVTVNYETMRGSVDEAGCCMRRLSTLSYVKAGTTHLYTTKWQWYWRDDDMIWKKYGQEGPRINSGLFGRLLGTDGLVKSDIRSRDIEEEYVQFDSATPTEISFCTAANKYVLDLKEMKQKNIKYGTERKVRRRPAFVPLNHGEDLRDDRSVASSIGAKSAVSSLTTIAMPSNWTSNVLGDNELEIIEIIKSGPTLAEYFKIESLFHESMSRNRHSVSRIRRIQNPELWEKYQRNKIWREKRAGAEQDERLMFHGTSTKYVDAICQQGFDWRLAGTSVGSVFGKGSYFAFRADLAGEYSKMQGAHHIFVVRVLVGKSGVGKPTYVKPPPLDPKNPLGPMYDTCIDRLENPRMVITFEMERSYPEYVIDFT